MVEKQTPPRRTMRLTHYWGRHGWLVIGLLSVELLPAKITGQAQ